MTLIDLNLLEAHPANANVMPEPLLNKLMTHIEATGNYPPLIVRRTGKKYQLLDGHHRAIALRRLGHTQANCDVWEVDDEQAAMLLLTLNRLHGEDDPQKRGELLAELRSKMGLDEMLAKLPDDLARVEKLIELTKPASQQELAPPQRVDEMPHAVTFFLTGSQRRVLFAKLGEVARDRSEAMVHLLGLNAPQTVEGEAHGGD